MRKIFMPLAVLVCLLLAACDKNEIVRPPIEWTWEILTPESVKYEGGSVGWAPGVYFKANGMEGDIVITCKNYSALGFDDISSDSYDCGWASLKIEGNKVIIHFPRYIFDAAEASEDITIVGRNGKVKALGIIGLTRTFEAGEQPEPGTIPEAAGFRIVNSGFSPFMHLDSPLAAPLDLITFRITDMDGNYNPVDIPD